MKLQIAVSRASLIFQKRFPDAVSTYGRLNIASTLCTRANIATTKSLHDSINQESRIKAKKLNFKNSMKLTTKTILYHTPCILSDSIRLTSQENCHTEVNLDLQDKIYF